MSRTKFCLYIFGPISLGYFVPLIFYEWPLKILTIDGTNEISPVNLAMAVLACVMWFGIAILLISYPNLLPFSKNRDRYWNEDARWAGFLCFSLLGGFFAALHRIFFMPQGIEQLVHQLSYLPTMGFILGLCCLTDLKNKDKEILKKILVFLLLFFDMLVVFALPIAYGVIAGIVISALGILFGMAVIGVRPAMQILALGMFAFFILGGLSIKHEIRILMCGGTCDRVSIKKVFQKEKKVELAKKRDLAQDIELSGPDKGVNTIESQKKRVVTDSEIPQDTISGKEDKSLDTLEFQKEELEKKPELTKLSEAIRTGEFLKNIDSQKESFESGYDPNYERIRFMPSALENSMFHYFFGRVLHRINRLGELGYIIQTTGEEVSYSFGKTYIPLLSKFIPRIIWPGKPEERFGQFFGHRYRFIGEENLHTAVNLSVITEGYMNWGWVGILLSAIFFGVGLRLIWEIWIGENAETGNLIFGMFVVMAMVLQEVNLSQLFGGLLYGGLVYIFIEALFRHGFSKKTSS